MLGQEKILLCAALLVGAVGPVRAQGPLGSLSRIGETPNFEVFRSSFSSPARSPFPRNDVVWVEFRRPKGDGPFPAVIVLPVLAAPNRFIADRFLNALSNRGMATVFVTLPYQFERRAADDHPSGMGFLARDPGRLAANFRQAILDVRSALDGLLERDDIDPKRIGLVGTSLGALVGGAVLSQDDRIAEGVLLLGGADLPSLLFSGALTGPTVRALGLKKDEISKHFLNMDPLAYRETNRGKRLVLYNAMWDAVVPRGNAEALSRAFPDAEQRWVLGGHYSSILHLVWLPGKVARHFQSRFDRR